MRGLRGPHEFGRSCVELVSAFRGRSIFFIVDRISTHFTNWPRMMHMVTTSAVHSDSEILGGTPVFIGTRVPVQNLIDYLEHGRDLDTFLNDFPSVGRAQAIAVLEEAKERLLAGARPAR